MNPALLLSTLFFVAVGLAHAYPPAPYYTLYGMVRDQVGQKVSAEGAQLILLKGKVEIGRAPISSSGAVDQNYELNVRIDQNRAGTTLYTEKAVPAEGPFSLVVLMNGARFYPIEVSGKLNVGKGSERTRLDLNLGEDSDGDGLPDVWEQWQLFQAGWNPDEKGAWPIDRITKEGDFDKDGRNNLAEYIAGTFAGDAMEFFKLEIKEKLGQQVRLEFFGITGKTYTLERSADNRAWERLEIAVGDPKAKPDVAWTASSVGMVSAYVASAKTAPQEFFRLNVR